MTELSQDVIETLLANDAWDFTQVGRLLLRVREDAVGPASDAWYVLVPEVPNTLTVGGTQATVTFTITVAGGGEIGGALQVAAPGLTGFSFTVVVNTATSGPPSFAFFGLPASSQGLPSTVNLSVTTPLTSLPTLDRLDVRVSTTGSTTALGIAGGIIDGTATQATAQVVVSQLDIATAIAALLNKGLANALAGLTTAPVQVSVPQQDPTPAALLDPQVRGCAGALLTVAPPTPGTLSLPATDPLHITLDLAAATSTYTWDGPGPLSVVAGLVLKDSVVKDNLTNHGSLLNLVAILPTQVELVSTASPPAYGYMASAVVAALDLMVSSTSVVANLNLPSPEPIRTTKVHIDDLPRAARVTMADFDPSLRVQAVAGVEFMDELGAPAAVGRVALSSRTDAFGVPVPTALASKASTVAYTAPAIGPTTLAAQAHDLESAHLNLTIAGPTTGHTAILGNLDLGYAAAHPAVLDLTLDTTAVHATADELPTTVDVDVDTQVDAAQGPTPIKVQAAGSYAASLPIRNLAVKITQGQPVEVVYDATVRDLPASVKLDSLLEQDIFRGDASMSDDVGAVTATVARTAGQSRLVVDTSSIPQWLWLELDVSQPDTYAVQYSAVHAVDAISATYTDTQLTTAQPTIPGVPPPNHLAVNVLALPATGADPTNAVQQPLKGVVITGGSGKVVVEANVPTPVPAIGLATFELTDRPTSTAPVTGEPITFSQCVRRIAGSPGDQLAGLGAPTGRRTYGSAPGLRALELNTINGLPHTTFGRLSANPVWLAAFFDAPTEVRLDLASDAWPMGDPAASSSWLSATASPVQQVAFDLSLPLTGTLPGPDDLTSMAIELVPQSVKVKGVLHTYDGSFMPTPDLSGDPDVIAAAHHRRIDLTAVLPDRLIVQTGAVEKAPAPVQVTRPPVGQGQWWTGLRVEAAERDLLPAAPAPVTTADVWGRVAQTHAPQGVAWTEWQQVNDARGHVRIIDTVRVKTVVPPSKDGKHRLGGGPLGMVEHHLATWEAYGHIPTLSAAEISTASWEEMGSKPAVFVGLDQESRSAVLVVDDQLDHEATSDNQLVVDLDDVPQQLGAVVTPASDFRVNNRKASRLALRLSERSGLRAHAHGGWVHGFPNLVPGPVTASDGTARPAGLSAMDIVAKASDLTLRIAQGWSAGPSGEPMREHATTRTSLQCRGGAAASGWLVGNRPGDQGAGLANAVPSASGIHLLQSSVNLPDYAAPSSLDELPQQGFTGDLYGGALRLSAVRLLTLETTSLVDENGDSIPVFLADDSTTHQQGREALRFGLLAEGLPAPLTVTSQQVEARHWPDAPAHEPADRLSLVLHNPPPCLSFANEQVVTKDVVDGRPRKQGQMILSSGNPGTDGLGGLTDPKGGPLGAVEVHTVSLNAASRFAPTLTSYAGTLELPGFVRFDSATTVDPSRFPGPGNAPTGLDMSSWDKPVEFPTFHASNHPWVTGRLGITASGVTRGSIAIRSAAQPWNSSSIVPSDPPKQIEWGSLRVADLLLNVPGGAPVDATGADPHVALVQGSSGPATEDEEKKGLGFRVRPDVQLTVKIGTGTAFDETWAGPPLTDGSAIASESSATIAFHELSGIVSLQAKDVDMTAIYVAAAAAIAAQTAGSFFGPIGWFVGDIVGTTILIGGVRICLSDNDPCVKEAVSHGSWRLDPDPAKIPLALRPWFQHFGTDGDPGSWHLHGSFWVTVAGISLVTLPALVAGLEALFAWIVELVGSNFIIIPMM